MAKRKKKQNNFWRAALVLLALLFVASTDKAKELAKKASEAMDDDDQNENDSCSCCGCCDCQCETKEVSGKVNVEKYQRTQDEDISGLKDAQLVKRFTTPNQTLHFEQKL